MREKLIDENTIASLEILSQLALSPEEQKQAMADLEDMVEFVRKMQEVDTTGEEPLSHIFPMCNVFREDDEVTEADIEGRMLANAPAPRGDYFEVPRTI